MKKRISDLLDDVYADDIVIPECSPLSAQRIKAVTMEKIRQEKPLRKKQRFTVLLAAAIITALVTTVVAAADPILSQGWFMRFFSKQEVYAQITQEQLLVLEQVTVEPNQSVTCDGYAITLERVISDGYCTYLQFHITAPEGVVMSEYTCFEYDFDTVVDTFSPDRHDENSEAKRMSVSHLNPKDDNPNDNQASVVVRILDDYEDPVESGTMAITGIKEPVVGTVNWRLAAEGTWKFQFDMPTEFAQVEMLSEPVIYFNWDGFSRKWHAEDVTSFSLRTLTAIATVKHKTPWGEEPYSLDGIKVVMKNGAVVEAKESGCSNSETEATYEFYFDQPISFADVAYVEFPGGARAMMPEE